jgi:hypothetical protein
MKGRLAIPDKIKGLKGTLRPCRAVITSDIGKLHSLPEFPDKYGKVARGIYENDAPYLLSLGLLTVLNFRIFTSYCRKFAKHDELLDLIDECHDLDQRVKLERLAKELWNQIIGIARDFAIPPVYWNKVNQNKEEEKNKSKMDNFLEKFS